MKINFSLINIPNSWKGRLVSNYGLNTFCFLDGLGSGVTVWPPVSPTLSSKEPHYQPRFVWRSAKRSLKCPPRTRVLLLIMKTIAYLVQITTDSFLCGYIVSLRIGPYPGVELGLSMVGVITTEANWAVLTVPKSKFLHPVKPCLP